MELFDGSEHPANLLINCFSSMASKQPPTFLNNKHLLQKEALHAIALTPTLLAWQ